MDIYIALFLLIAYASIAQSFIARMDGGGEPQTPEFYERVLAVAPYSVLGFLIDPIAGVLNMASYATIGSGHGQYFPDMNPKEIDRPQSVDPIVRLFFGADPRIEKGLTDAERMTKIQAYGQDRLYKRNMLGMFLSGLALVIVPVITSFYFLGFTSPVPYLLFLTSFGKMLAYHITHRLGLTTEEAEYANGGQRGLIQFTCIAILPSVYIMWA